MTDYSKMTDAEINEAIFKAKGWAHGKTTPSLNFKCWYKKLPDGFIDTESDVPDYTHSWELCGELLEEIDGIGIEHWGDNWIVTIFGLEKASCDTPLRAICEAWLPWREQGLYRYKFVLILTITSRFTSLVLRLLEATGLNTS